ncbi:Cof-type HAD-IIB family hydrolase [Pedobacter montanisoli]|uniref:Cof-type HAD-IIB family hydrolase n=1 Tax=Pedobacter montanisoli TaxID=2923277 RepID=A0ABS9ZZZ0_9SPHI|nr:Cof-type HAD-IIB family hydrolase [Pedobacter montanisoli]MCJ0743879.1 Cof-type HAD-IIB family hydrolase [Pedobacter montanisoli]
MHEPLHQTEAVFFDFDGTLQGFDTHQISSSTMRSLHALKKKGIKIFIATGRSLDGFPALQELEFDGYIFNNGVICADDKRDIFHISYIDEWDVKQLIEYSVQEKLAFSIMKLGHFSINHVNDYAEQAFNFLNIPVPEIADPSLLRTDDITQLNIFVDEDKEHFVVNTVMRNVESSRWMPYFADINPKGLNKMAGVAKMAERFGIDLSKTLAFGDGGNDKPMLAGCGFGVAMGTASTDVKQAANYVTHSADEDGVYKALKYLKLL